MNTKKVLGAILIAVSLGLGYLGYQKVEDSDASVEVLGLEIEASDNSAKEQGFLIICLAVVLFGGGIYSITKKG